MRLVILSNMAHYYRKGRVVGHGATAREIDHLANLFDEVVHVACLHEGDAPASMLPYTAANVCLHPVPPAGGNKLIDKLGILRLYPHYARTILHELRKADAVHVRCPANISLLAILLLSLLRHPKKRWYKYAGSWQAYPGESWSYKIQRWWLLKRLAGGRVTVNGNWTGQPDHIHSFLNPCMTDRELSVARQRAERKQITTPVRLLFVGSVVEAKGAFQALEVVRLLHERHVPVILDVVGDGAARPESERRIEAWRLTEQVCFHGWVPRHALGYYYEAAHLMILPSRSEGWPKVLSEGMAYGAVPVASSVGSIPQYLEVFGTGKSIVAGDTTAFTDAVVWYVMHPEIWKEESLNGVAAAQQFSYSAYVDDVQRLLGMQDITGVTVPDNSWTEAVKERD